MEKKNKHQKNSAAPKANTTSKNSDYICAMGMAPKIGEAMHWFQMLPTVFFTAFIIMIVRYHSYQRPMSQFYWTNSGNDLVDFFSYYKMIAIVICAIFALIFLLYRIFTQSFYIKRSPYYVPMVIYSVFVMISYFMSDYKEFTLWGWNDRFEGTITLLAYMIMLFFVINTVNNEKNVKQLVYAITASSIFLSLVGLSQTLDHDFFKTPFGKKLITPSWFWNQLDSLTFTFKNKEIYQTVYNINYVSFYLTLLIPLFGLLFIRSALNGKSESLWKKVLWSVLFGLTMYNLIGSRSSGGFLGIAVVVLVALIVLNKTILKWWRPVAILLVITILLSGITYEKWLPELSSAAHSVLGIESHNIQTIPGKPNDHTLNAPTSISNGYIDYIETKGNNIYLSYEGNKIAFTTYPNDPSAIMITDGNGKIINIMPIQDNISSFALNDERFKSFIISSAKDSAGINYFIISIDGKEWPFAIIPGNEIRYCNDLGNLVSLKKVDAIGWKDNQSFGSGRGYIWSRTLPIMKKTILIGNGADTYCLYFPQNDYVGKYNADWDINKIVDKPHNMYMGAWLGTGGISILSLLFLWFMYIIQSINLFWKRKLNTFTEYTGLGIFLGICGFLISGLVNDSTVSVMPMFYGLLGTGIAINIMLKREQIK